MEGSYLAFQDAAVTERWGLQLPAAQKPTNRPGWWKGKFASFQMLAAWWGVETGDICPKASSPQLKSSGVRDFLG